MVASISRTRRTAPRGLLAVDGARAPRGRRLAASQHAWPNARHIRLRPEEGVAGQAACPTGVGLTPARKSPLCRGRRELSKVCTSADLLAV